MPRTCTVCRHANRADIDKALITRQAFRTIAGQFGVSKTALMRHHDDHLPASLVRAQRAREATQADGLCQVLDLRDEALGVLDEAKQEGDLRVRLVAIHEACRCVELLAKLAGQLADAPTINIIMTPEWLAVQTGILAALKPYPDARSAVAASLESHNGHAPGHA